MSEGPEDPKARLISLYNDTKEYFADGGIQFDKPTMLKISSVLAGAFLIVAGTLGTSSLVLGTGFVYFIGSLYAIVFGLMVQARGSRRPHTISLPASVPL